MSSDPIDRMTDTQTRDYNGQLLREGAHVEGWHDGLPYFATVKEIGPPEPGSGCRRVILVRDGDQVEVRSFPDVVAVITEEDA